MWLTLTLIYLTGMGIPRQALGGVIKVSLKELPEQPSVVIAQGTVVGSLATNRNYAEFYGIPYADATSGNNRFKVNSQRNYLTITKLCNFR